MEEDWRAADSRARDRQRAEHVNQTTRDDVEAAYALYALDGSENNALKWGMRKTDSAPGS